MSTRTASKKKYQQIFELSPNIVGKADERVTREMRKGVPDEYNALLNKARTDTDVMVKERLEKAARLYVPKLYTILIEADYPPKQARVVIKEDCRGLWSEEYVLKFLPDEVRDKSKQIGGRARQKKLREKLEIESKEKDEIIEQISPQVKGAEKKLLKKLPTQTLKGLAAADEETRQRVAASGGNAKYDQHPEDYSEMGKTGMENRWGGKTLQLVVEQEEHQLFVNAYKESVQSRDDGTGAYTVDIKNGDIEKVEPIIGNTQQSINK